MAKKTKSKAKAQQTKIPGTERRDAIPDIEEAASAYREARDARMELQEQEAEAQLDLTNAMRKHGVTAYKYEDGDGKLCEAYLPGEVKAKVRRLTEPKAPKAD